MFVGMQIKRQAADYDPDKKFLKSEVLSDISAVEAAISDFDKASPMDKRAFAAFVLFKERKF